jgi:hypothetical protein
MTQNEIKEMAVQAGFKRDTAEYHKDELESFAALVAAKEREACAKVCEAQNAAGLDHENWWEFAAAIRARGQA